MPGPPLSHAAGRRQASLGIPVPRMPTAWDPDVRNPLGEAIFYWLEIRRVWGNSAAHVQSTATRRPRPQVVRARGASLLPFRLPARPSPGAPWARGLPSAFWEQGSPDLPACGLWRGSRRGPARPIFINIDPRPSRGIKPRGADDTELPQARPHQAGSQGGREIKAGHLTTCP